MRRARLHQRIAEALEEQCGDDPGERLGELAAHWAAAVTTTDTAKGAARDVTDHAKVAASQVVDDAKARAGEVRDEARAAVNDVDAEIGGSPVSASTI